MTAVPTRYHCPRCGAAGPAVEPVAVPADATGLGRNAAACTECAGDEDVCHICGDWVGSGYLCAACDDVVIHRQHNPTDPFDGFTFYFGAASGSARKVLRQLQAPNVMINYATELNEPWPGIDRLFIDSGGYSFMKGRGEYETSDADYLAYVAEHAPEQFALRDYPCEPEVLAEHGRSVADHQRMTTERHASLLDKLGDFDIDADPVAVVQGWHPGDYVDHAAELADRGLLTDTVAIGSVCGRDAETDIRQVVLAVREAVPDAVDLHAFGVKGAALRFPDVREALVSADSQSFEMKARWDHVVDFDAGGRTWHDVALEYLRQRRRLRVILAGMDDITTDDQAAPDGTEQTGVEAWVDHSEVHGSITLADR